MKNLGRPLFWMLMVWTKTAFLRPLYDTGSNEAGSHNTGTIRNHLRVRRSASNLDDLHLYSEGDSDSPTDHELQGQPGDPKSDVSPLIFANQVSNIIQSLKSKNDKKHPSRSAIEVRAINFQKEEDSINNEGLPSDEQEECYRQQNLEPPSQTNSPLRPSNKENKRKINEDQISQSNYYNPDIYKRKGSKHYGRLRNEVSLYSDPDHPKKETSSYGHKKSSSALEQRVYRPIGVQAEFPIYDEDIDFHPDPLQGILEDKYWLDSEQQEEIIKKYLDLANQVNPPRLDYIKRDTPKRIHEPKSVDSKVGFKTAQSEGSPMISACEDCQRGKWRRRNNTSDRDNEVSIYGSYVNRKLLSNNDGVDLVEDDVVHDKLFENKENYLKVQNLYPPNVNILRHNKNNENPVSYNRDIGDLDEEIKDSDGEHFVVGYYGRKLLSVYSDDSLQEEYDDDEEEYEEESMDLPVHLTKQSPDGFVNNPFMLYKNNQEHYDGGFDFIKNDKRRSVAINYNSRGQLSNTRNYLQNTASDPTPHSNNLLKGRHVAINYVKNNSGQINYGHNDTILQLKRPYLLKSQELVKYYVPDRFGNLFQKSMKQNPKYTTQVFDASHEFELIRNETFINASVIYRDVNISITTEMPKLVKHHKKRGEESIGLGKERRSYPFPFAKRPTVKSVQGSDDAPQPGLGDPRNITSDNSSKQISSVNATLPENITINAINNTIGQANFTVDTISTVHTTSENVSTTLTTMNPKKKEEEEEEDLVDAEIANDIVETVIAESQRGSMMGHNLGLCRKNESMTKYAKVSPETELLLKKVTECILDHIREHLERQSCTLLEDKLLQFLKWMVLGGESYRSYLGTITPEYYEFSNKFQISHDYGQNSGPQARLASDEDNVQDGNKANSSDGNSSAYSAISSKTRVFTTEPNIQPVTVKKT